MHDIDRTQLEMEWEAGDYEGDYEAEYEGEYEGDYYGEFGYETYPEMYGETYDGGPGEYYGEAEMTGLPFSEAEEMELAAELLEVSDDAELDQFLGSLIKRAARGVSRFAKSRVGRALRHTLRGLAKRALPIAGAAVGSAIAPGVGTAIGGRLGSMAGRLFGLELEGLSPEDQEFEVARRFVRFAGDAARQAAMAPAAGPHQRVAQVAIANAARKHAPGLAPGRMRAHRGLRHSGRWIRRGHKIIVLDV